MIKRILCSLIFCLAICFSNATVSAEAPMPGPQAVNAPFPGFDPDMSEEELMEQFKELINEAIPEDDREEFWRQVDEETERLERETAHMSEKEKEDYLLNLITAEPEAPEEPKQEDKIEEEPSEPIELPKAKTRPIKETKQIADVLKSIVKSIESFLNKAAAHPDFEGKINRWAKQKRFADWPAGKTWQDVKDDLNNFIARLERFKEKDPKIGMKHINALTDNEQVVANLKQLEAKLEREVPSIELTVFSLAKISEETKSAITRTVNALTEALYRLNLPEELLKILAEFDPVAKKILAQEEKAAKAAQAGPKGPTPARPTRVAGKTPRDGGLSLPSLDDLGFGGRSGAGRPRAPQRPRQATGAKGRKPQGKGAEQKGADKGKDKAKGKDDKDDTKDKGEEPATIKSPNIKRHVENFGKDLKEAHDTIMSAEV